MRGGVQLGKGAGAVAGEDGVVLGAQLGEGGQVGGEEQVGVAEGIGGGAVPAEE